MSHSQATAYVNKVEDNCTSTLCNAPDVAPVTCKGALCIIHDFIFEKVRVRYTQHSIHPRKRILFDAKDALHAETDEAAVGDVADVAADLLAGEAAHFGDAEGEVDEAVLEFDHGFGDAVDLGLERVVPELGVLDDVLAEELRHGLGVERLVGDGPGDDLAHALHRAVSREVEQHDEGRKELHALGECREGGDLRGEVAAVLGDFVEEVVLGGHGLVLQELVVDGLGEPDRLDEVRVGGDVHGLARGERREHHSDLGLTEAREVVVDVGARDVDVALGEEAQDLREEVALAVGELLAVVLDVLEHGHFGPEPVHLLGLHEGLVGPGVLEGLEAGAGRKKPAGGVLVGHDVVPSGQPSQARQVVLSATACILI